MNLQKAREAALVNVLCTNWPGFFVLAHHSCPIFRDLKLLHIIYFQKNIISTLEFTK